MVRRSKQSDTETLRKKLIELFEDFENKLLAGDLRGKVLALVPAHHLLRDMGSSLVTKEEAASAQDRIILYLRTYPKQFVSGDELMVISGIGEWARRVRELRVELGWNIVSGVTAKEMIEQGDLILAQEKIRVNDYVLLDEKQDREAAFRWKCANTIRKKKSGVREKLLDFLKLNVGRPVRGEELRYVANGKSEWARRLRELRTEEGWAVATRTSGRPDLDIGTYVLENLDQAPAHDRKIPDEVRGAVLMRDRHTCTVCGWKHASWNSSDPRHLELHHVVHHVKGGANSEANLVTLCTLCHRKIHNQK